jgi:hypothetical protein
MACFRTDTAGGSLFGAAVLLFWQARRKQRCLLRA